jgi:pimeloyl-ACP methyl ester carboxylesterase
VTASDGVSIAYRDYGGDGPGLVLLPGIGGNLEALDGVAERLGAGRHTVSIDPRGCGQSGDAQRFRWQDTVTDVEDVIAALALRDVDIVGHSMGGVIAGYYATKHPQTRIVSIDGFGAGVASQGTAADAAALTRYMDWARTSLLAMTAPPEHGDLTWKQHQVQAIRNALTAMGYHAPHRDRMIERQFVAHPDGTYRRHPARQALEDMITDTFGADPPRNILDMFRGCTGPTLIIRCTASEWPAVLDTELDDLASTRPNIRVVRLPLTHTAPVTDSVDQTAAEILRFLATTR